MNIADVFAVAAALCNIAMVWPQAIKTVKLSNVDGVSISGWWVNLTLFVVWSVYAAGNSLPILLIANISCTIAAIVILINAQRYTPTLPLKTLLTGLLLTSVGAVLITQSSLVVAVLLLVSPIVSRAPHIISAIRSSEHQRRRACGHRTWRDTASAARRSVNP